MFKNILFIAALTLAVPVMASVSLSEYAKRVGTQNFTILENAQKVYQAKESIALSRGELMPSLNIWKIAGLITNPFDVGSWTEIVPFLAPGNWYRFDQTKVYYSAERESYKAMAANQVLNAKILFLQTVQDQRVYDTIKSYRRELSKLHDIAQTKADLGFESSEVANEIRIRMMALDEDLVRLKLFLNEAKRELSYASGGSGSTELEPSDSGITLSMKSSDKIPYSEVEGRMLQGSYELRQYNELLRALPMIKKEISFGFLGLSQISKGTSGGYFDQIPIPSGLGFGTGPAINIANSHAYVIELQKRGVVETLRKQAKSATDRMAAEADLRPLAAKRRELASENVKTMMSKLDLGESLNMLVVADSLHTKRVAEVAVSETEIQFRMQREKVDRLLVLGDYSYK